MAYFDSQMHDAYIGQRNEDSKLVQYASCILTILEPMRLESFSWCVSFRNSYIGPAIYCTFYVNRVKPPHVLFAVVRAFFSATTAKKLPFRRQMAAD